VPIPEFLSALPTRPALQNTARAVFLKHWFEVPCDWFVFEFATIVECATASPG